MHKLGQALQTFNQARAWTLNDVYVDMVYLVRFDRVNMAPVSAFVDQVDISAVRAETTADAPRRPQRLLEPRLGLVALVQAAGRSGLVAAPRRAKTPRPSLSWRFFVLLR